MTTTLSVSLTHPASQATRASFSWRSDLVNQIHEHDRNRDVVNRACGRRGLSHDTNLLAQTSFTSRELSDAQSAFFEKVNLPTKSTSMVATVTLSTVRADTGAEARHQLADAHDLNMPRELGEARSFIENGGFVNQAHEHDRDRRVVNRACG